MNVSVVALSLLVWATFVNLCTGRLVTLGRFKAGITRIHNYYRALENATNMEMMVWDRRLEQRAAVWSEKCLWRHEKLGLGENLAYQWSTGTLQTSDVIITGLQRWYKEKYAWSWSTQCGGACHYTQMIWAVTRKVGCAYSICARLWTTGTPIRNAHYLVCFYDPPGNYNGQYPFKYGQSCSQCSNDAVCRQKLCCRHNSQQRGQFLPYDDKDV